MAIHDKIKINKKNGEEKTRIIPDSEKRRDKLLNNPQTKGK